MTDNAEREAFKKVCPCHPEVYWHETMKRWVTHGNYLLEAHAYHCQWQGFQAGRAVARAEVKAERDALKVDAERYRWLRHDDNNGFISPELARGEKLDEEIDAYLTRGLHLPPLNN